MTDPIDGSACSVELPLRLVGASPFKVCIGIATRGRPAVLAATVDHLRRQTLQPLAIIIACTNMSDVGDLAERADLQILVERPGTSRQRNAILRHLPPRTDIIVFFDDDFVAHPDWLAAVVQVFATEPRAGSVTGHVIRDGIKTAGITFEDALSEVMTDTVPTTWRIEDCSPYGCNMAFRCEALGGRRFDERLVLYGWLEDRDVGGVLARDGWKLLKATSARGVHMGIKSGRTSGIRLGYSQVSNPAYLYRKGTMSFSAVAHHVLRNIAANIRGAIKPEPFIDRRGRLRGNLLALRDLCGGRVTPDRAEEL